MLNRQLLGFRIHTHKLNRRLFGFRKLNRRKYRFRPLHQQQHGDEPRQYDMDQRKKPDRYLCGKFSKLNQSPRLRFRASELREMIAADHVTVYRLAPRNRCQPTNTKAVRHVQLMTPSTTTTRLQQTAESSNELKQSAGNDGFVNTAQNVKRLLDAENRLTDTHHQRPHRPLLFNGIPLRSDTQQYASNSRLTARDTSDGDGHQPHYTQVIKH